MNIVVIIYVGKEKFGWYVLKNIQGEFVWKYILARDRKDYRVLGELIKDNDDIIYGERFSEFYTFKFKEADIEHICTNNNQ
jgi:hypothetical protein